MRHLGIDFGKKRVGVALSDEAGNFALPHSVLANDAHLVEQLKALCAEQSVGTIVMGESKDFKQVANPIMKAALVFKAELEKATGLPVHLEPEFMTSA